MSCWSLKDVVSGGDDDRFRLAGTSILEYLLREPECPVKVCVRIGE